MQSLAPLVALVHHRWSIPLLAELHRTGGAKFVTLANRLALPKDSLQRTLASLVERGLVKRNEGYGHPLRPEYLLTARGQKVGDRCTALVAALHRHELAEVALRKWSLPLMVALAEGASRFNELKARLDLITPRALTLALKELTEAGLVEREVVDGFPPSTSYTLARRAVTVAAAGREIATALAPEE